VILRASVAVSGRPWSLPLTGHQAKGVGLQDLLGIVNLLEMFALHSCHVDCIRMLTP
jgi:hypothetical protein